MAVSPAVSDSPSQSAALPFSDTVRKVDRAVARLEELQCMVRGTRSNATYAKRSPPNGRSKLALHAEDCLPNRNTGNGAKKHAQHASCRKPALPINYSNREQGRHHAQNVRSSKCNGLPVAISRRSARVANVPPPAPHKQVISSPANNTPAGLSLPCRMQSPPDMPLSSPPSSACSSSVQVVTRRVRLIKDTAPSNLPRACLANVGPTNSNAAPSRLPRTFFVHAGPANPNRPWCLSTSPSPATTSSTTSNYIYSPSSNSSVPLPTKYPSRFSPLHRQISGRKSCETLQSQPLLCKSQECANKPIKASPKCPRKTPWFNQTRLSLCSFTAPSPSAKRPTRRFSLASNTHQESPPRPLPALITRLPTRRKKELSPDKKPAASPKRKMLASAGSTPNASPQEGQTMIGRASSITLQSPSKQSTSLPIPPLPLPPALQARPSSTQHLPTLLSSCKMKPSHKRSNSCPRQCLLPLADGGAANVISSPPLPTKHTKKTCFLSTGKENCFSGCRPAAWPCMRSWSFSQEPSLEASNSTDAGPYLLRHVKGYMQNGKNLNSQSQLYKVDSDTQGLNEDQRKLYIG